MYIIIKAVDLFFYFLSTMILIRVIISWIPGVNRFSPWVRFIDSFTDPFMEPIQRFTFKHLNLGMVDISPFIALLIISFVRNIVIRAIYILF